MAAYDEALLCFLRPGTDSEVFYLLASEGSCETGQCRPDDGPEFN